jgi:hypothetical protein
MTCHLPLRATIGVLLPALLLGACADRSKFPSLDRRPAERRYGTALPVDAAATPMPNTPLPLSPDASLATRLAALREKARVAHDAFTAKQSRAAEAASTASGATVASESWSVAQVRLAELESSRSDAMIALADLDHVLVIAAQTAVEGPDADLRAVEETRAQVSGWIAEEDGVLATLRGRVR